MNFRALESFHVADFAFIHQSNLSGIFNIFLKDFVFGNKVGFGVYFDNRALVFVNRNGNQAFGSDTAGFFSCAGQTFFAQPVNGLFHIPVSFGQGFFAVHHACAGSFAQFFN